MLPISLSLKIMYRTMIGSMTIIQPVILIGTLFSPLTGEFVR